MVKVDNPKATVALPICESKKSVTIEKERTILVSPAAQRSAPYVLLHLLLRSPPPPAVKNLYPTPSLPTEMGKST